MAVERIELFPLGFPGFSFSFGMGVCIGGNAEKDDNVSSEKKIGLFNMASSGATCWMCF